METQEITHPESGGWSQPQIDLLKRTICKGATDDELALFVHICKRSGLDPFSKQIYAVKRWSEQDKREIMSLQTGIDGYRTIAQRTGEYAGNDEPIYDSEVNTHPNKATVRVYRLIKGIKCCFSATARWDEYKQAKKDGKLNSFWVRMPYLMLAKCAEALALRKAFPAELAVIYTHDEMGQADNPTSEDQSHSEECSKPSPKIDPHLLDQILDLIKKLAIGPEQLKTRLAKINKSQLEDLTDKQATLIIGKLQKEWANTMTAPPSQPHLCETISLDTANRLDELFVALNYGPEKQQAILDEVKAPSWNMLTPSQGIFVLTKLETEYAGLSKNIF